MDDSTAIIRLPGFANPAEAVGYTRSVMALVAPELDMLLLATRAKAPAPDEESTLVINVIVEDSFDMARLEDWFPRVNVFGREESDSTSLNDDKYRGATIVVVSGFPAEHLSDLRENACINPGLVLQ